MKRFRFAVLAFLLFVVTLVTAQTRGVAKDAIPGDNNMRYYRLALPVTVSAYQQDLGSDYNNVLHFWRECEDFANRMFVPLGICFDVVEDSRLVMSQKNMIDDNIYNVTSFGTELTDAAVGSTTYDVGMWIHHRGEYEENSGLSVGNGVYNTSTKSSGYAKTDKWVVAHELGHMFGADFHTSQGEGSLMDNEGEFFSYPSILLIRQESVKHGVTGAYTYKSVTNSAPVFDTNVMKDSYRIPQGACIAIPVSATDEHIVTYSAIGCSSANVTDVNGEDGMVPYFRSLAPQSAAVIDYRPQYRADIYDEEFYFVTEGTDVPSMSAGSYPIAFLANDMPEATGYDYLTANPFYSNYSVWDATVQIVGGTAFNASLTPQKNSYSAGEAVTVMWGVNSNYFTDNSRLRITMSANYGESFDYVLAESVPATDGSYTVVLPNVNIGNVDVDFVTATRSMRGGIIRIEEIGGVAYTLTTLSPENGGGFNITGSGTAPQPTTYTIGIEYNSNHGYAYFDGEYATIKSKKVNAGEKVTLKAETLNDGYEFDRWTLNGNIVSTESIYTVTAIANAVYVANFKEKAAETYTVTATANPAVGGTVSGGGTYVANTTATLTATPNTGYMFVNWTLDGKEVCKDAICHVNVTSNSNYVANYEAKAPATYTVTTTASPVEGGFAKFAVGTGAQNTSGTVNNNELITLYATANSGYTFINWTLDGKEVCKDAICHVNVTSISNYVANFKKEENENPLPETEYQVPIGNTYKDNYLISVTTTGAFENVTYSANEHPGTTLVTVPGIVRVGKGESFTLNLVAYSLGEGSNYTVREDMRYCHASLFTDFDCDYSFGDATQTWGNKPPQHNVYGNYDQVMNITHQITVPADAKSGNSHIRIVYTNAWKDFPAGNAPVLNQGIVYDFVVEVIETVEISANASTGGTVKINNEAVATKSVIKGSEVTLTATALEGYEFDNWTKGTDVVSTDANYTFNATSDGEYVANFKVNAPAQPTTSLAGKWFRIRTTVDSAIKYMNVGTQSDNSHGNVNMVDYNKSSADQVFFFEQNGNGYGLKSLSGHYINCKAWNVDANCDMDASVLLIEENGEDYCIKWHNSHYQNEVKYFKVNNAESGDKALHPYCDATEKDKATWTFEEVVDLSGIYHEIEMKASFSSIMLGYNTIVPENVEAYNATSIKDGYLSLEIVATKGEVIPANTPVILYRTDKNEKKRFYYSCENAEKPESSLLSGSLYQKFVKCDDNKDYYKLMIKDGVAKMYWMYKEFNAEGVSKGQTDEGGHIKCNANKIYMALPILQHAVSYGMRFVTPDATDIDEVLDGVKTESGKQETGIYDLQGRKVENPTTGIYIINGKKMLVK